MIRIVRRVTASAVWDIEDTEVRLPYRKEFPESAMAEKIKEYREILQNRYYEQDNGGLCKAFRFFGGIAFVAIGMSSRDDFLACFAYYTKQFTEEWAAGDKRLKSKFVGYEYVFTKMLQDDVNRICYDFRCILDETADSKRFCQIIEQEFAGQWISIMIPLMEKSLSLADVAKRVGNVRVSRYLMQIPELTKHYLERIATTFTARRELVSLNKMTHYIFGHDSRSRFANGQPEFFDLLQDITDDEASLQKRKFVAENRRELDLSKDTWTLYQNHGSSLKLLTVNFTNVRQTSLRHELKCFLKWRFSGHIRASDRMFISLFEAANRLCETNRGIHYFADVDRTDVKNLQFSLENEAEQSKIMTMFSACRTLFSYLCSDENDCMAPKPHINPFESLRFVNAHEYHENTPYIPDEVLSALSERMDELSGTDKLVFEIFSETGMRAKEVVFLEANCLEKTRNVDAVMLSIKH